MLAKSHVWFKHLIRRMQHIGNSFLFNCGCSCNDINNTTLIGQCSQEIEVYNLCMYIYILDTV